FLLFLRRILSAGAIHSSALFFSFVLLFFFSPSSFFFFFFNHTATTEIYTLSLHDALPIFAASWLLNRSSDLCRKLAAEPLFPIRSEERFSRNAETDLVCRLLLEKKKKKNKKNLHNY